MNAAAQSLGMLHTTYTDPSGLAATTVSTARDQLLMATAAMTNPVFAAIVALPSATFPMAGTVVNFNHDVGHYGIVGVKTGSDSQAQGCWAFAAARTVAGAPHAVFGVVLGIEGTSAGLIVPALAAGLALADAVPDTVRHGDRRTRRDRGGLRPRAVAGRHRTDRQSRPSRALARGSG